MGTEEALKNLAAASKLARRLFEENRRMRVEINQLRALHEAKTADVEIGRGRVFRLLGEVEA